MLRTIATRSSVLQTLAPVAHEQAVLVLPHIDQPMADRLADVLRRRASSPGLLVLVEDDLRLGFMHVANQVFARSQSPYFGYLAQDAYPGEDWLACALHTLDRSAGHLLAFSDGRFFGRIAAFGLARRAWIQSLYGDCLFHPGYVSHFGDTELSVIAIGQGGMVFNPHCLLVEVDYEKHCKPNNESDDALYRARATTGFDGAIAPFTPA